jgi:hypothetical protein
VVVLAFCVAAGAGVAGSAGVAAVAGVADVPVDGSAGVAGWAGVAGVAGVAPPAVVAGGAAIAVLVTIAIAAAARTNLLVIRMSFHWVRRLPDNRSQKARKRARFDAESATSRAGWTIV